MLSPATLPLIRATLPLVASRLDHITAEFYRRLFADHPGLLDGTFSRSKQTSGAQPRALAASIVGYATLLVENPDSSPDRLLASVAHKHASLGVTEAQYQVVYDYLFPAIADDLGDVLTPDIATAWTEVYWTMARTLIALEKELTDQQAGSPTWADWTVTRKTPAGTAAMTLHLERAADDSVPGLPGQFVSVRVPMPDGTIEVRQYSLSGGAQSATRREITVKRVDDPLVSATLHDTVHVGDVLQLSQPFGAAVLTGGDEPLVLASAGIGCTPIAAMLRALADAGSTRPITVLHSERTEEQWALREQMRSDAARLGIRIHEHFTDGSATRLSLAQVEIDRAATVHACGPLGFMQSVRADALAAGIPPERVWTEMFGPEEWTAA